MMERAARPRADGRRPQFLAAPGPVLALDLGASLIRAAVVDADGRLASRSESSTPVQAGPGAVVAACLDLLRDARAGAHAPVVAVGVSAPGPLDPLTGRLVDPPNMGAGFHDVELGARLADGLDLPVAVDRDTRVALLAEAAFGAAIGLRDVVYLTVSTGVGGAVLSDGQPLMGPDGTAGELGHMCVELDGPLCGCGARGHLEALASGSAIARLARESGAFEAGVNAKDVAAAEEAGDAVAAAIMGRARRAFAAACVSIVDIFDPELVVVGGAVARNQGDRWLDPAREEIKLHAFRSPGRRVRIVPARLGADVGLVGAQPLVGARASAGALIHPSTKPVRTAFAAVAGA